MDKPEVEFTSNPEIIEVEPPQVEFDPPQVESQQLEFESQHGEFELDRLELESDHLEHESDRLEFESERVELDSERIELESDPVELESDLVELDAEHAEIETQPVHQKSKSFTETADRLFLTAVVAMLGMLLIGYYLLWLIGGGTGQVANNTQAASAIGGPVMAQLSHDKLSQSDPAAGAVQSDAVTLEDEAAKQEVVTHQHSFGGSDWESNSVAEPQTEPQYVPEPQQPEPQQAEPQQFEPQQPEPQQPEPQQAEPQDAEPNEFRAPEKSPIETSFRPSYPDAETNPKDIASEEIEDDSQTTPGSLDDSTWETDWKPQEGPIDEPIVLDDESAELTDVSATDTSEITPEAPVAKRYPMRIWTSALGNKAKLAFVRVEDRSIVVVDEKGREHTLLYTRFSEEDVDYVREAIRD